MNKKCNRCGVVKPESDFKLNRYGAKTYRRNVCRECYKASLVSHEYDERPDGRVCKRCNIYRPITHFPKNRLCLYGVEPVCKACKRERRLAYIAEHPECVRRSDLKYHYGLTLSEFNAMLAEQQGKCAICEKPMEQVVVEHDHRTGRVRGLACNPCNWMLGHAREDPEILERGAAYLRAHGASNAPTSALLRSAGQRWQGDIEA